MSGGSARARSGGPVPARRRSPTPIIIIVLVLVAGVACWVVGKGCGGSKTAENDKLKTYVSTIDKPIERSAFVGQQLNNVKNGVNNLSKSDVEKQLSQMVNDCKSVARESGKVTVPSRATSLQPLAQLALNLRAQGMNEFSTGMSGVLNGTGRHAAEKSMSKGLEDLVVADQVFQRYRGSLEAKVKAAKLANVQVADPGQYVPSVDDASSASVNAYTGAISVGSSKSSSATKQSTTASNPAQAITAYMKNQGADTSDLTLTVASESASDTNWKIDKAVDSAEDTTYFLLHNVDGNWTIVNSGSSITAAQIEAAGAPGDLTPP